MGKGPLCLVQTGNYKIFPHINKTEPSKILSPAATQTTIIRRKKPQEHEYRKVQFEISKVFTAPTWPRHNHVQISSNTSGTHYVQHVVCTAVHRDSSAMNFERVQKASFSSSLLLLVHWVKTVKGGNQSTQRKPLMTSPRNNNAPNLKSQPRLRPALLRKQSYQPLLVAGTSWGSSHANPYTTSPP